MVSLNCNTAKYKTTNNKEIYNAVAIRVHEEKRDGLVRQFARQWNAQGNHAQVEVVEKDGLAVGYSIK